MSTVPGFPNAASVLPTDTLWITRASLGAGRDLEATAAQVGAAGMSDLPAATMYRNNEFPVMQQGIAAARFLAEDLFPVGVDLTMAPSGLPTWNQLGSSQTIVAATSGRCSLTVVRNPPIIGSASPTFKVALSAVFFGYSGSSTDTHQITLTIPISTLPSGWGDALATWAATASGKRYVPVWVHANDATKVSTWAIVDPSHPPYIDIALGITWAQLMPTDNKAYARLHVVFETDPIDLAAWLPY